MSSSHLDVRTAHDIDARVEKILSDLGDPPPPLQLDDVRALLRLDRAYYSSSDDGILRETVHRLKLAGKQVIRVGFQNQGTPSPVVLQNHSPL